MGKIVIMTSGKGGTGVSCAAAVFAAELAETGRRVLLVDLAAGFRTQDFLAAADELLLYDLADAVAGRCTLQDVWYASPAYGGVWVLPAPGKKEEMPDAAQTVDLLRRCAQCFDHVVVDCPANSAVFSPLAGMADDVVVCCTADPMSVRACSAVREELAEAFAGEARLIISKFDEEEMLAVWDTNDLDGVIDGVGLRLLGVVPRDTAFARWMASRDQRVCRTAAWAALSRCCARLRGEAIPLSVRRS